MHRVRINYSRYAGTWASSNGQTAHENDVLRFTVLVQRERGHKQVTEYMILKYLSRAIASAVHYPGAFEVASGSCLDAD
jgi:hypothetical protein